MQTDQTIRRLDIVVDIIQAALDQDDHDDHINACLASLQVDAMRLRRKLEFIQRHSKEDGT